MPRSRRRANDRSREAKQRVAARRLLKEERRISKEKLSRYVKSVYQSRIGEVLSSHDGQLYQVQEDGSLRRVVKEGGMS